MGNLDSAGMSGFRDEEGERIAGFHGYIGWNLSLIPHDLELKWRRYSDLNKWWWRRGDFLAKPGATCQAPSFLWEIPPSGLHSALLGESQQVVSFVRAWNQQQEPAERVVGVVRFMEITRKAYREAKETNGPLGLVTKKVIRSGAVICYLLAELWLSILAHWGSETTKEKKIAIHINCNNNSSIEQTIVQEENSNRIEFQDHDGNETKECSLPYRQRQARNLRQLVRSFEIHVQGCTGKSCEIHM
ncbi:hypothetical protein OIU79_004018 [Salix purpurea]|uniref:Uncharacterized protein n=1 Tax=Salix purpurea TaxID=77065 RepID=A0A9Q0U970_SALPP|nr:hypothetical protein OIU79_004018 [Salix purpurea]